MVGCGSVSGRSAALALAAASALVGGDGGGGGGGGGVESVDLIFMVSLVWMFCEKMV